MVVLIKVLTWNSVHFCKSKFRNIREAFQTKKWGNFGSGPNRGVEGQKIKISLKFQLRKVPN